MVGGRGRWLNQQPHTHKPYHRGGPRTGWCRLRAPNLIGLEMGNAGLGEVCWTVQFEEVGKIRTEKRFSWQMEQSELKRHGEPIQGTDREK